MRTAQALITRGHKVTWVFSSNPFPRASKRKRALEIVESRGIRVDHLGDLRLVPQSISWFPTPTYSMDKLVPSAKRLGSYFYNRDFDCIVIDRSCVTATFSAHLAHIPWAVVGSDGRDWVRSRQMENPRDNQPESIQDRRIREAFSSLVTDVYAKPSVSSCFGTSPFLNISFFPKSFFATGGATFPGHSHFLGDNRANDQASTRDRILITFGNTMPIPLKRELLRILLPLLRDRSFPALVLTGSEQLTAILRGLTQGFAQVEIRDWVPYGEAFRAARTAIGHGGTAHVWYGIHEATPLVALPCLSDQRFGATQIERLGIGYTVAPISANGLSSGCALEAQVNDRELVEKLEAAFTRPEPLANVQRMSLSMRSGGGVNAAATLLELLAHERAPVTDCAAPACCC